MKIINKDNITNEDLQNAIAVIETVVEVTEENEPYAIRSITTLKEALDCMPASRSDLFCNM